MTKVLSEKQIKELITAYTNYKKAENNFKRIKEALTKDLKPGKYESASYGYILKSESTRTSVDLDTLLKDHPQIDVNDYTITKQVVMTTIHNLK